MKFGPDIELIYWDIGCQYEKKIGPLREFYVLNDVIILKSNDVKMTHKWLEWLWYCSNDISFFVKTLHPKYFLWGLEFVLRCVCLHSPLVQIWSILRMNDRFSFLQWKPSKINRFEYIFWILFCPQYQWSLPF